jgi:hypothetical protein
MGQDNSKNPRQPNSSSSSPAPDSAKHKRDPRNLIQASRAPAEPSLAQARGTSTTTHRTHTRNSQSNAAAHLNHPSPSQSINSSDSQMGTKQSKSEPKQIQRDQPSKPVDVPTPAANTDSGSLRSLSNSIEPSGPPATQDMSYHLTRPPRLPLPIEEEVHTPGSPIIAPADLDAPVLDVEALDNDPLPRRTSALSNTTIDEEDAEELRVDKTKATVPTTFEWRYGGDKVYVTGTIFQWNKKHRLHPVYVDSRLSRVAAASLFISPSNFLLILFKVRANLVFCRLSSMFDQERTT